MSYAISKSRCLMIVVLMLAGLAGCSDKTNRRIPYVKDPVDMALVCMDGDKPVPYKDCSKHTLYGFILGGNQPELGVVNLLNGDDTDFDPSTPAFNPMYLKVPAGSLKRIVSTPDSRYVFVLDYTEADLFRVSTTDFKVKTQALPCRGLDMVLLEKSLFITCPGADRILKMPVDAFGKPGAITTIPVTRPYRIAGCKDRLFLTHTGTYNLTFMDTNGNNARDVGVFRQCSDGIDNDHDGLTDNQDPGCTGPGDNDESDDAQSDKNVTIATVQPAACSNHVDDDGDGLTDMDDPACYNPLGISEAHDPIHRVNALVAGPDCKYLYVLRTDPAMVMVLDADTGAVVNINQAPNTSVVDTLGIRGALLDSDPRTGVIVKDDKGTYLWIALVDGRVVKFQVSDDKGVKNVLTDSGLGERDAISTPQLLDGDKPVEGGFSENVDYPSLGPQEITLIPDTDNEYSFYGVRFNQPNLEIPTEQWDLTYEGRIPHTASVSGVLDSDGTMTDLAKDFCALGVEKGDRVVFTAVPGDCSLKGKTATITAVLEHSVSLNLKPETACLGKGLSYYIHAHDQWVLVGSITGFLHPWYSRDGKCVRRQGPQAEGMQGRVVQSMPKQGAKLTTCPVYPGDPEIDWKQFQNMEFSFYVFPGCTIDQAYNITAVSPKPGTRIRFTANNYLVPISTAAGGYSVRAVAPPGGRVFYLVNQGADEVQQVSIDDGAIEQTFY